MAERAPKTRGRRKVQLVEEEGAAEAGRRRRRSTLVLLSALLGFYGVDRLYAGRTWSGLLKAGLGVAATAWWVTDLVAVAKGQMAETVEERAAASRG